MRRVLDLRIVGIAGLLPVANDWYHVGRMTPGVTFDQVQRSGSDRRTRRVTVAATFGPARRAIQVDPVDVLNAE